MYAQFPIKIVVTKSLKAHLNILILSGPKYSPQDPVFD